MAALTKRDKKLIYFCSVFAAASLSYMILIAPKMNQLSELETEYIDASTASYDISLKLSGHDISKLYLDETMEQFKENTTGFCQLKETEEIDEYISQSARNLGLVPQALSVSNETLFSGLLPYSDKERSDDEEDEKKSELPGSEFIFNRECSVTVSGTMPQVLSYIDLINNTDGFRTTAIDFTNEALDNGDTSISADSSSIIGMISFMIYRYDKEGAEEYISTISDYYDIGEYDDENTGGYDDDEGNVD